MEKKEKGKSPAVGSGTIFPDGQKKEL
jgi:hypothetical protein